ncbi:MAG: protein serine/threonine phosphatase 2C family protein [Fimbriimonadaceae bacterium]|nr:protein serine/threonine phosphatase 2C family protein [Fimbriimonadaceae bacterium]
MGTDVRMASKRLAAGDGIGPDELLLWQPSSSQRSPLGIEALLAVVDGVGEPVSAAAATGYVKRCLERVLCATVDRPALASPDDLADYLRDTIAWCNDALREAGVGSSLTGASLTIVLLGFGCYVLAHVGSARAYRLRGDHFEVLTADHSGDELPSRFLGLEPGALPDLATGVLQDGDRLLICSDGLHGVLPPAELQALVQQAATAAETADRLALTAGAAGGDDSLAIAVAVVGPPANTLSTPSPLQRDQTEVPLRLAIEPGTPGRPAKRFDLRPWLRYLRPVLVLAAVAAGMFLPPRRSAESHQQVQYPNATPIAVPQPPASSAPASSVPAPPPAAPQVLTLGVFADGRDILVALAKAEGKLTLRVGSIEGSQYEPQQRDKLWAITLQNKAVGQSWQLKPAAGTPAPEPANGTLGEQPPEVLCQPGSYTLWIADLRRVAAIRVVAGP